MRSYSLSHLADHSLLQNLAALVARDRTTTAEMLAHIAEVDGVRLYAQAGYPSMHAYCLDECHFSEDSACKRIRAARVARRFPAVFCAVADGRLHLAAVVMLAPYLEREPENADELLVAATHKTKAQIELLIAERFPRPDLPTRVRAMPSPRTPLLTSNESAASPVESPAPGRVEADEPKAKTVPLAPQRFALQLTMSQSAHDKLRHAQALLSHQVADGDLAKVLERVLDLAIQQLEKRKFAATDRPRKPHSSATGRHIPAHVKRAVRERDGDQCTFVSDDGRRCSAKTPLEFDHIVEVARGGPSTIANLRLLCRTHNQYGAEHAFGAEFMKQKRREAQRVAQEARAAEEAKARAAAAAEKAKERTAEVIDCLRSLGFRVDEAKNAAALCETIADAPLEDRVKRALTYFVRGRVVAA